jgi:hypothetical protein
MKRRSIIYIGTVIAACMLSLQSCNLETSDNGNLDGNWQLMEVDTLATGGVANVKNTQIFYSVQVRLINLRTYNDSTVKSNLYFHFENTGDSLKLKTASGTGKIMYDVATIRPYGLNKEEESFKILSLDEDNMQLRSDLLVLKFRKF